MKHLRKFNEDVNDEVILTVKEILYPLTDNEIEINYSSFPIGLKYVPDLSIEINDSFKFSDYKNEFKSLLRYFKNNNLEIDFDESEIAIEGESYESCPDCNSDNIEFFYTRDEYRCLDCDFESSSRDLKLEDFDSDKIILYLKLYLY